MTRARGTDQDHCQHTDSASHWAEQIAMNLGLRYKYTQICTVHIQEESSAFVTLAALGIPASGCRIGSLIYCNNEAKNFHWRGPQWDDQTLNEKLLPLASSSPRPRPDCSKGQLEKKVGHSFEGSEEAEPKWSPKCCCALVPAPIPVPVRVCVCVQLCRKYSCHQFSINTSTPPICQWNSSAAAMSVQRGH